MKKIAIVTILILSVALVATLYTTFNENDCWKVYPSGNESSFITLCPEGE